MGIKYPNPAQKPYSFLLSIYKTLKNTAVVLLPFVFVVEQMNLPGEYGMAASLVAYWMKNFVENWKR